MKIIAIEEHVLDPAVAHASAATLQQLSPYCGAAFGPDSGLPYAPSADVLRELGAGRLAEMDKHGITRQVPSNLSSSRYRPTWRRTWCGRRTTPSPPPCGVIPTGSPPSRRCPPPSPPRPLPNWNAVYVADGTVRRCVTARLVR